jgi:ribonuclease HII
MRFLIGIDEAGRAPLAGPVAVGAVIVPERFDVAGEFPGVRDSKLLTEKKREEIYELLKQRVIIGDIRFCVRFSDHHYIDEFGITRAVRRAVSSAVQHLSPDADGVRVLLDGLLVAPKQYTQQTIIHGDELVPLIALASIAAKVRRDRLMHRMAKKFPEYGFEHHVGYPTRAHRDAIAEFGLSTIHRVSFCKNIPAMR